MARVALRETSDASYPPFISLSRSGRFRLVAAGMKAQHNSVREGRVLRL